MFPSGEPPILNPIWIIRGMPAVAMILIALAMFALKSSPGHDFCLGAALGLLISYTVVAFQIKRVDLQDTQQPSDVTRYPLT